jgi:hypothetical protein
MKSNSLLLKPFLFILVSLLMINCGGKEFQSQNKTSKIVNDGVISDWDQYNLSVIEKNDMTLVLGLANNDTSLNVMFKLNDKKIARMMEFRGFTLWFNNKNKKDKIFGIQYRNKKHTELNPFKMDMIPKEPYQSDLNRRNFPAPLSFDGQFFFLSGEDSIPNPLNNFKNFFASAGSKKSFYFFEFEVPIRSKIFKENELLIEPGQKIKVGLEIAAVSKEIQEKIKERMEELPKDRGGMRGGGIPGGGKRGGGPPGGMGGFPGQRGTPDLDSKEIWITVKLAMN